MSTPRSELAKTIPRRPRVSLVLGIVFAFAFAALVMPLVTADRWLASTGIATVVEGKPAMVTVRVPALAGFETQAKSFGNGGIVIARGSVATAADVDNVAAIDAASPKGALPYVALFLLPLVLGAIFTHHMRRSTRGRLVRVQLVSLATIIVLAIAVKGALLVTSVSALVVPVALLSLVATMALDRVVGLATGVLAALVVGLLGPFDIGVAIVLLVQAAVAGLVVEECPKDRLRAAAIAGAITTVCTAGTFVLLSYLTTGKLPFVADPLHSPWFAALLGPAIATVLAVPLVPVYQLLVGEITRAKLAALDDFQNPLLKQIAEKAPGTWQHSLAMANLAEIAASAIGASPKLVRVGALYHDLGKSLSPKYFIENLQPGDTSPHDKLPPEVSCDAIFAHVTEGIVAARKAGLHERIVDFMHMHHGNGVLEYFWGRAQEQGNPKGFTVEDFRYPGHPPQSRETAILAICDAVEAASRTLKKPDVKSIDALVQRIVYGKLHLGQLDESGLSMADLRILSESLKETIRAANHSRIEYPWQKAEQDASASEAAPTGTQPRLDSLDRSPEKRPVLKPQIEVVDSKEIVHPAYAQTADLSDGALVATAPVSPAAKREESKPSATAIVEEAPVSESQRAPVPSGLRPPRAASVPPTNRASSTTGRPPSTPPASSTRTPSTPPPVRESTPSLRPTPESAPPLPTRGWTGESRTITPNDLRAKTPSAEPVLARQTPADLRGYRDSRDTAPVDPSAASSSGAALGGVPLKAAAAARSSSDKVAPAAREWAANDRKGAPPAPNPNHWETPSKLVSLAAPAKGASWTEQGATDAPWPEHGEPEPEQPGMTTLKGGLRVRPPEVPGGPHIVERDDRGAAKPQRDDRASAKDIAPARASGPPVRTDLDNATTNPPPLRADARYNTTLAPTATARPPARRAEILDEDAPDHVYTDATATGFSKIEEAELSRMTEERMDIPPFDENVRTTIPPDDAGRTSPSLPAIGEDDSPSIDIQILEGEEGRTNPSMPRFIDPKSERSNANVVLRRDLPLRAPTTRPPSNRPPTLADRIDAAMATDDWGTDTPVKAPTSAELRNLLGAPDPTRQQSIEEIERLHASTRAPETPDPDFLRPRRSGPTNEVDPDDIEAAIEIVPPQRRPSSIAIAKPKKPE